MKALIKGILFVSGTVAMVVGFFTFWLPIPMGLPLMIVGTFLLMKSSRLARRRLISIARKNPRFYYLLKRAAKR